MSWQEFVDSMLITQGCSGGALFGQDGTVWAQTGMEQFFDAYGAEYTQDDGTTATSAAYTDAQRMASYVATGNKLPEGIRINHKKYMPLRTLTDDGAANFTVYARCPKGELAAGHDEAANPDSHVEAPQTRKP
mmetsp:Transcript_37250/g.116471  ORF Transcript_37250/g.116471 Transcript_37250/m.116471 type:complete len:133 (-) Transcript_37250:637-1035(-)